MEGFVGVSMDLANIHLKIAHMTEVFVKRQVAHSFLMTQASIIFFASETTLHLFHSFILKDLFYKKNQGLMMPISNRISVILMLKIPPECIFQYN